MVAENVFIGFFVEWLIAAPAFIWYTAILTVKESIYIGPCLYITAMVKDFKTQIDSIDFISSAEARRQMGACVIKAVYVKEIHFHIEIIE